LFSWAGLGVVPAARERQITEHVIESFAVKTPSSEQSVANLSGGNQQKVVLGRWTTGSPNVFISKIRRAASTSLPNWNSTGAFDL